MIEDFEESGTATPRKISSVSSADFTSAISEATTTDEDSGSQFVPVSDLPFPAGGDGLVARFLSRISPSFETDNAQLTRLVERAVRMLKTCKYEASDIATVLAIAAVQHSRFQKKFPLAGSSSTERTFILLAQIYIAHCLALDECCNISNWHKYLFASYCDLRSLNCAIGKIMKKMNYELFVSPPTVCEIAQYIEFGQAAEV